MNTEYQIWTWDDTGKVLHAGVHKLGKISLNTIRKLERKWQAWRHDYIANHPGDYPLAQEKNLMPKYVRVYPVGNPELAREFTLS